VQVRDSLVNEAREDEQRSCEWSITTCDSMVIYIQSSLIHFVFTWSTVTTSNTSTVSPNAWEESTGLLSSLIPQTNGATTNLTNPQAFNSSNGELKLGPAPIPEELRLEAERVLREQAMIERDPSAQYELRPVVQGVVMPSESDLPPLPPTFKTIDINREVEKVRDARKRIRLDPSALSSVDLNLSQSGAARARALPSICAYTLHDAGEG
jgi:transcription initiation factor TFIID subunit 5